MNLAAESMSALGAEVDSSWQPWARSQDRTEDRTIGEDDKGQDRTGQDRTGTWMVAGLQARAARGARAILAMADILTGLKRPKGERKVLGFRRLWKITEEDIRGLQRLSLKSTSMSLPLATEAAVYWRLTSNGGLASAVAAAGARGRCLLPAREDEGGRTWREGWMQCWDTLTCSFILFSSLLCC